MAATSVEQKVSGLITDPLSAMGYELVRVLMLGKGGPATLQIMAEHADQKSPMTVDDCAAISRAVSEILDADENIVPGEYSLEVSSPGIDRPLVRAKDYSRFAGHLASVELTAPQDGGRKRFKGTINKIKDETIEFTVDNAAISVPMSAIAKAKLVLTDALIKSSTDNRQ